MVIRVAAAGVAEGAEARKTEVAALLGVVDAVKDAGMERITGLAAMRVLAAGTAGGLHVHVGEPEQPLERALLDLDLLQVGEAHGGFLQAEDAGADAKAAVGDDIPVQLEFEPQDGQRDGDLREKKQDAADFKNLQDDDHPRGRLAGDPLGGVEADKAPGAVPGRGLGGRAVIGGGGLRGRRGRDGNGGGGRDPRRLQAGLPSGLHLALEPPEESHRQRKADDADELPETPADQAQVVEISPCAENADGAGSAERRRGLVRHAQDAEQPGAEAVKHGRGPWGWGAPAGPGGSRGVRARPRAARR